MRKNRDGQLEVVLENRQLLVTFFVIVGLCGVFFSLGYIVGRNTFSSVVKVTQAASGAPDTSNKPSAMPPAAFASQKPQNAPAPDASAEQPAPATDLNFYQSVEEKAPEAKLVPPQPATAPASAPAAAGPPAPAASKPATPQPHAAQPAAAASAPTIVAQTAAPQPAAGFLVQVSALSRREDANTLVALLKGKNLPVQVNAGPSDNLFHVVLGPYQTQKEAEHAKTLLEQDGFRPIIKH